MKLTKYEHACVTLEEQNQKLLIDPSKLTQDLGDLVNVTAVVFTHSHYDHFSLEHATAIVAANPNVIIFGTQQVARLLNGKVTGKIIAVTGGTQETAGPFQVQFFGELHAMVNGKVPGNNQNVGVLVNDNFYYPGDSYTVPESVHVKTLALPVSGPWVTLSESTEFLRAIHPDACFLTHDALLPEANVKDTVEWFEGQCSELGVQYISLGLGQSAKI